MRPEILNPLFKRMSSLSSVGTKSEILFNKLLGEKLVYFLWNIPYNLIKREILHNINQKNNDKIVIIKVNIIKHYPSKFKRQPYKINCKCNNVDINIVFFHSKYSYLKSILPEGEEKYISGKLEYFKNSFQITHPSYIVKTKDINSIKTIEPIYKLTAGITNKFYLKSIDQVLNQLPNLNEWINEDTINKFSFLDWKNSILEIHNPKNYNDLLQTNKFRRRLAFDELLAHQLSIAIIRNYNKKNKGLKFKEKKDVLTNFINNLPFLLTESQKKHGRL